MIIIGVDPGVSGGISILENKKVIEVYDMPTMIEGKKNKRQVNGSQVTNIIKENVYTNKETTVVVLATGWRISYRCIFYGCALFVLHISPWGLF